MFVIGAVDPVQEVHAAVEPEEEDVVAREVLHFAVPLQRDELRDDRDGLEDDAKVPQDLHNVEAVRAKEVPNASEPERRRHRELEVLEGVLRLVVGALQRLGLADHVHDRRRRADVCDLHEGVVEAVEPREEVDIPAHKHDEEELLGLQRDAVGVLRHAQPQQQHDDAEDVAHVAHEPEDVHVPPDDHLGLLLRGRGTRPSVPKRLRLFPRASPPAPARRKGRGSPPAPPARSASQGRRGVEA
mmetsp:Transcript_16449/g.50368  ORF Transcript_16449/g.50368 Transcript_16449/m.50368 type:complete len:243 (+) Transcript_16449:510-1238(+)